MIKFLEMHYMKILEINTLNETGSTGRIMQGIANAASEEGFEVITAYGYGRSDKKNAYRIGSDFSYYFHNSLSRLTCAAGRYSHYATKRFISYIKSEKPDLIHLHNIHSFYVNYPMLFKYIKNQNIPVVWTLHDCWAYTGKCTYYSNSKCSRFKTGCGNCPIIDEYPQSLFLDRSKADYKLKKRLFTDIDNLTIVTPSKWLAEEVKQSYLKNKRVEVINNGINLDNFSYIDSDIKNKYDINKKVVLGVASEWTKRKGLNDFVELSKILSDDYQIVLIGVDEKTQETLPSNVIAINRTENVKELAKWYSISEVLVNPTYEDNFPTVNLESLACNTPVITYETGGSPESIFDQTGIVLKQGDIKGIASSIDYICLHKDKYANCSNIARERYDEKTIFKKYAELYSEILQTNDK